MPIPDDDNDGVIGYQRCLSPGCDRERSIPMAMVPATTLIRMPTTMGYLMVPMPSRLDPAESVDTDNDGIGNNADPDDDNDGVPDVVDDFPLDPTRSVDTDGDGIDDLIDTDDDNDGVLDINDAFPLDATESVSIPMVMA